MQNIRSGADKRFWAANELTRWCVFYITKGISSYLAGDPLVKNCDLIRAGVLTCVKNAESGNMNDADILVCRIVGFQRQVHS